MDFKQVQRVLPPNRVINLNLLYSLSGDDCPELSLSICVEILSIIFFSELFILVPIAEQLINTSMPNKNITNISLFIFPSLHYTYVSFIDI